GDDVDALAHELLGPRVERHRRGALEAQDRPGEAWHGSDLDELAGVEEDADLTLRRGRRVGPVHDVLVDRGGAVTADGAGYRVLGVGGARHLAPFGDGVLALDDHGDHGTGRDEGDEALEEGLA